MREGDWVQLTFAKTSGIVTKDREKKYRKIPKISPGAYIFQRRLFEGLIYGGKFAFQNQLG